MNNIVLCGRITKDLELRYTTTDKAVCEFSLAVNRVGQEGADFINCQVWGKQAQNLAKYQGKGSLIAVNGALRTDTYEVEGNKRYKTYVLVSTFEFLGTKKEENAQKTENIVQKEESDPFAEFGEEIQYENMELPFD